MPRSGVTEHEPPAGSLEAALPAAEEDDPDG